MGVDFLSLVLIIIAALGVCGLGLIFWHHKGSFKKNIEPTVTVQENNEPAAARPRIEPIIANNPPADPALTSLGFSALDVLDDQEPPKVEQKPMKVFVKNFVVIYLLAPNDRPFVGYELFQTLLSAGLRFGDMNIFHYHAPGDESDEILFSLASAVEPGIFDLANIGGFSCPGLSFFMSPKLTQKSQANFDLMLETARQIADDLGGQLHDEERELLTKETIATYRNSFVN